MLHRYTMSVLYKEKKGKDYLEIRSFESLDFNLEALFL